MQGIPVYYAQGADHDEPAFKKLAEQAQRCGSCALVVCAEEQTGALRDAPGLGSLRLFFEHLGEEPPRSRGLPALAYRLEPARLLDLLDDRRVSVVIYVPRNAAELRHFTLAYPECASV
ncbi:MAG: hypothetical protein KC766_12140 [Myxococcales bacterium]|nr:hypothetical protein [Myxococcales bacterium]